MMAAITEVRQEMDRRYELRSQGADIDDESEFPTILLAIDEISRFTTEVRMWWSARRGKGMPPCFADWLAVLWQGREARVYCVAGVHNPNARVLVSGDARSMFATRIAAGPQDAGAWRMLFGNRPVPRFSARKGRAWVAMGVDAEEIQLYYGGLQDARALALSRGGQVECPTVPPPAVPAETPPDVPDTATWPHLAGRVSWPAAPPPADGQSGLIVGLAAAADHLGTTYEAFRKLRERNGPIPGERRVGNAPAWPCGELRDWYARLPRAGRKLPPMTGALTPGGGDPRSARLSRGRTGLSGISLARTYARTHVPAHARIYERAPRRKYRGAPMGEYLGAGWRGEVGVRGGGHDEAGGNARGGCVRG
jgi:hypothetical protein